MNLTDVNVLIYAFRKDTDRHPEYRAWLLGMLNGNTAFGMSEQVLASFIRITTHSRIFKQPATLAEAIAFAQSWRQHPLCRIIHPTTEHWQLFIDLCAKADAKGNLITDAWLAALAIESGCTWITTDRDFARFPNLIWKHPLDN